MAKIGANVGICLGNKQDNFQLDRFTASENIAKSFLFFGWGEGALSDSNLSRG